MPWDHINYFEGLEVFVNNPIDALRKLVFSFLDYNNDGYISEIDLWVLVKSLPSDIFVTVAIKDILELVNHLQQKK
jgi:Ca2+-binding EF-hand superfamily protein